MLLLSSIQFNINLIQFINSVNVAKVMTFNNLHSAFSFLLIPTRLLSFYLLIEEEVLNAVCTDVFCVQQTIQFEAESALAVRVWIFS